MRNLSVRRLDSWELVSGLIPIMFTKNFSVRHLGQLGANLQRTCYENNLSVRHLVQLGANFQQTHNSSEVQVSKEWIWKENPSDVQVSKVSFLNIMHNIDEKSEPCRFFSLYGRILKFYYIKVETCTKIHNRE